MSVEDKSRDQRNQIMFGETVATAAVVFKTIRVCTNSQGHCYDVLDYCDGQETKDSIEPDCHEAEEDLQEEEEKEKKRDISDGLDFG